METQAILERIQYQKGAILPAVAEEEEIDAPEVAARVMRLDRGRLLVRVDEKADFVALSAPVALEVPTAEALYRLTGLVEKLSAASDGMPILMLRVDEIEMIQRRKQARYEVSYPCRFALVEKYDDPTDILLNPLGSGRVTDISLGGIALETESSLPVGALIKVALRLPDGRTDLVGRLLKEKVIGENGELRTYGIKIDAMDLLSSKRLSRLVLRLERRERRQKAAPASIAANRPAPGTRRSLTPKRRWSRGSYRGEVERG